MKVQIVDILGVRFDNNTQQIAAYIQSDKQNTVFTPNAEMLVYASHDSNFKDILNRSSLNICDGSGPAYMARIFQKKKLIRESGVDYLGKLLAAAAELQKSVFFLGTGNAGVLADAVDTCKQNNPHLLVAGQHPGIELSLAETNGIHTLVYDEGEMSDLHAEIIMTAPDILIVGFGHPKQELFIDTFIETFPTVRLAMGVGGSLDFYAGKVKRAPILLRKLGLESIWRLIVEPWRWKRVFTALVIFPILYLRNQKST